MSTPLTRVTRQAIENQLTGALAQARVLRSILTQQVEEYAELWETIPTTALADVATAEDLDWTARRIMKLTKREAAGTVGTQETVNRCTSLTRTSSDLRWHSDESLAERGITVSDRDAWAELIVLAADIVRTAHHHNEVQKEIKYHRDELGASEVRSLRGYYVKVENSRRTMYGWIDKGRGKSTVIVTVDPLAETLGANLNGSTSKDVAILVWRATVHFGHSSLNREDKMSWTDSTKIEVILPPADAANRRADVAEALTIGQNTREDAQKATQAVQEWQNDHEALVQRRAKVERVYKTFDDFDPMTKEHIVNADVKTWITAAQRLYGVVITDFVLRDELNKIGGSLSIAEMSELATAPAGSSDVYATWTSMVTPKIADANLTL